MPGVFIAGETKTRPGVYTRYENAAKQAATSASNGIGAIILQAQWGPLNQLVTLNSAAEVAADFGSGLTAAAAKEMFNGGCSSVKAVRVGTGGAPSSVSLTDDAEAAAVTITAKCVGARAFSVTVKDSLIDKAIRECIVYSGSSEFERVTFPAGSTGSGEPAALVAAFANSKNFVAAKVADGSKVLKAAAQKAFTVGTNPTAAAEQYSAALNILEAAKFNVLCVDTVDVAIHALVAAFIDRIYASGAHAMACLSEPGSTALVTRMADAAAFNDEKICYVLNSAYDSDGNLYDGYLMAARIGGMIAAVESSTSLTHTVISDFTSLAEALTNTQVESALESGCIVLSVNSSGQVWIESGINTLVSPAGNQDAGWKKIRRTKTRYELMDRIDAATEPLIGKINNDANGRATFIAAAQGIINDMISEKKLLDGGVITEDPDNPATNDSAWFVISVNDVDSVEKSYLTFQFKFSAE